MTFVGRQNPFGMSTFMLKYAGDGVCDQLLNAPSVKNLRNSTRKYDLVITEVFAADCSAGFAYRLNASLISVISSTILPWGNDRIGNPDNPSYIPNYFLPYTSKMTLFQRVINTALTLANKIR